MNDESHASGFGLDFMIHSRTLDGTAASAQCLARNLVTSMATSST
jgi:hypothetical protein